VRIEPEYCRVIGLKPDKIPTGLPSAELPCSMKREYYPGHGLISGESITIELINAIESAEPHKTSAVFNDV